MEKKCVYFITYDSEKDCYDEIKMNDHFIQNPVIIRKEKEDGLDIHKRIEILERKIGNKIEKGKLK